MKNITIENCPICGSVSYTTMYSDHNRRDGINCYGTYVRCTNCSLVYLRERPDWKTIADFYSAIDSKHTNTGITNLEDIIERKNIPFWKNFVRKFRFRPHSWPLAMADSKGRNILDIGCGCGAKLMEFAERKYNVWGVDVGLDAIKMCQNLLPDGHFFCGELQKTNLPENYFDFIRVDNALEHMPNCKDIVQKCYHLLKPGGKLLIYVPNGNGFTMRFMKKYSVSSWIPFHLQLFTPRSANLVMREVGFKDIRVYGYNPTSWIPLSFSQLKRKNYSTFSGLYPYWFELWCYPVGWITKIFGLAEELVVVCKK